MFETAKELSEKLSETGYFIDPTMTKVVFLAARMQKPLLLEGPAGIGADFVRHRTLIGQNRQKACVAIAQH